MINKKDNAEQTTPATAQKIVTSHALLGQISQLQRMVNDLLLAVDETACYQSTIPELPPLAWLLGRCVYIETYWLREIVQNDNQMTARVKDFFGHQVKQDTALWQKLPPREHLLNWAMELQENNLLLLANPNDLPEQSLTKNNSLLWLILHEYALRYEQMLMQLQQIQIQHNTPYHCTQPLHVLPPSEEHAEMHGGHYRIGEKTTDGSHHARDIELPTQIVELSSFRIDTQPVSNGAWLGFLHAGGYANECYWSKTGQQWLQQQMYHHPDAWSRDNNSNWYGIGINGPYNLIATEPVSGISHHEALAYANWVASLGGIHQGAVVQHEYQWEAAKRTGALNSSGQVREWCANTVEMYSGYKQGNYSRTSNTTTLNNESFAIRSHSLHSNHLIRYAGYRHLANPTQRFMLNGTRLVFPPSDMPWH